MINFKFEKLESVDSTNDYLANEVEKGILTKDKILIARLQSNGHGSDGKEFISDKDVGIYFSILHFYKNPSELKFITQKAAVAVYMAFKEIFDIELSIKWINDLYYNNKKVVGILCKNMIKNKAVIIGIGIDLFRNDNINEEIKDIAGYIFRDKNDLLTRLNSNAKLPKESCAYKNISMDFKALEIDGIDIDDSKMWEPDQIVIDIAQKVYSLLKIEGLPKLYIEKNIIKDKKIYEDCIVEC